MERPSTHVLVESEIQDRVTSPQAAPVSARSPLVVVVDDALDAPTFERCRAAIDARVPSMRAHSVYDGKIRFRRWQDYDAPDPVLLQAVADCLYEPSILLAANREHDLAWRWFAAGVASAIDLQLTSYAEGGQYTWHTDHLVRGRTHNFILFMSDAAAFTGGELQISYAAPTLELVERGGVKPDRVVRPARNRLVLMPSHLLHRVTPVSGVRAEQDVWSTRLTINGHVRVPGLEGGSA